MDLNSDGTDDLIVGVEFGYVGYYMGIDQGPGSPPELTAMGYLTDGSGNLDVGFCAYPSPIDWNQDGLIDLAIGNGTGEILVYLNCGTPEQYQFDGWFGVSAGGEPIDLSMTAPVCRDLTGDGLFDLIIGYRDSYYGGRIYFAENTGSPTEPEFSDLLEVCYGYSTQPVWAEMYIYPSMGDYNGDGVLDLLAGEYAGIITVYPGESTGIEGTAAGSEGGHPNLQLLRNPVYGLLSYQVDGSIPPGSRLQVIDIAGRTRIESGIAESGSGAVSVGGLPEGVYFLVLHTEDTTCSARFTVLN